MKPHSDPGNAILSTYKEYAVLTRQTDKYLYNKWPFYWALQERHSLLDIILYSFHWICHWKHLELIPLTKEHPTHHATQNPREIIRFYEMTKYIQLSRD